MKITSFNPMIVTKDLESVVAIFEALGFEKSHNRIRRCHLRGSWL